MNLEEFIDEWNSDSPWLVVHTSGSTGKPKALRVEKRRMKASAEKTCRFLGLSADDTALLCMPLDYIAGKMVVVRSLVCGMKLVDVSPSSHPLRGLSAAPTFAAMVPMQVYGSMEDERERRLLMQIKNLIIGGGAIDEGLERELRAFPNAVWSTYGMTETLSHIAMRRVNGSSASDFYTPLDGVTVSSVDGCLLVDAPDVCETPLQTNDVVEIDASTGCFRVLGRRDNVVCTGGIKVQIEEVERILRPFVDWDFALTKRHDVRLGEELVMVVAVPGADMARHADIVKSLRCIAERVVAEKYWRPRHYCVVDALPQTATGKIARAEVERLAGQAPCM